MSAVDGERWDMFEAKAGLENLVAIGTNLFLSSFRLHTDWYYLIEARKEFSGCESLTRRYQNLQEASPCNVVVDGWDYSQRGSKHTPLMRILLV